MPPTVNICIEPNEKYREVIWGEPVDGHPLDEDEYYDAADYHEAAESYCDVISNAPTAEEYGEDPDHLPTLTWSDIAVSSDPDLVTRMATYFTGMNSSESTERLRAKLRLLDVDVYVEAQIAARAELRSEGEA